MTPFSIRFLSTSSFQLSRHTKIHTTGESRQSIASFCKTVSRATIENSPSSHIFLCGFRQPSFICRVCSLIFSALSELFCQHLVLEHVPGSRLQGWIWSFPRRFLMFLRTPLTLSTPPPPLFLSLSASPYFCISFSAHIVHCRASSSSTRSGHEMSFGRSERELDFYFVGIHPRSVLSRFLSLTNVALALSLCLVHYCVFFHIFRTQTACVCTTPSPCLLYR